MIKLLAIDLDGTLLNENLEISKENIGAINLLRDTGVKVIIATGRPEQLVKPYIDVLDMEDNLIMYNGSVIGHPFKKNREYSLVLDKSVSKEIIEFCEEFDCLYMCYTKEAIISKPNYRVDFFENRNKLLDEKDRCVFKDIRNIDEIVDNDINKILIIENDVSKNKKITSFVKNFESLNVVQSQNGFIDVNPKEASKGKALAHYAKKLGIDQTEVAAIGDQDNDVSMLEYANVSIAMGNASDKAKGVADYMTLSNEENGVAVAIMKYILKK